MPRNATAGKAAAGPSNTSKDITVTVSKTQAELAAANAEIKRLRKLLEARDTPASASNNESSDARRLTTVLEALSQHLNGSCESCTAPSRSAGVADPFKVQDARLNYNGLTMKTTETFSAFQTRFLHLAGQARIPHEDLMPDLFDKLTLDLQRVVLPVFTTVRTLKELTDQCLAIDQGLRRIKARADRMKARNPSNQATSNARTARNAPVRPATPAAPAVQPAADPAASRAASPAAGPAFTRPTYSDPRRQALSNQGACFSCGQKDHFAKDCSTKAKADEVLLI